MHRANAFIIYRALGGKESYPENLWPMWSDKKEQGKLVAMTWGDTPEEARENMERIMKQHNPNWQPKTKVNG